MTGPLVSVVIPVYNPGEYLDACVASLLSQSLPADQFEAIFVNDGSTDGTHERLDDIAARHPNLSVLHEENSGWAGRPRNVGVRHARGEYVQFLDQDDYLNDEALERMYAMGSRNAADVVLGKIGGTMQGPSSVFARNRERCSVDDAPLIDTLTPHKMFRRQFLVDEGIWYPEGRVRLEDQMYMVKAYLRAENVSIVGDYVCYYWMRRSDGRNTSSSKRVTPDYYFSFVRQLLDLMVTETEPGPRRDHVMSRTFRVEMMTRLREPSILSAPEQNRQESYAEIKRLAEDFFRPPSGAIATLPPTMRLRAHLLLKDKQESLINLARRQHGDVRPTMTVEEATSRHGRLHLTVRGELTHRDGSPIVVVKHPRGYWLEPRFTDRLKGVPRGGWNVPDPLDQTRFEFRVHDDGRQTAWYPPVRVSSRLEALGEHRYQVVVTGRTVIDPRRLGPGLGPGEYSVTVGYQILGHGTGGRLPGADGPLVLRVSEDGGAVSPATGAVAAPLARRVRWILSDVADTPPLDRVLRPTVQRLRTHRRRLRRALRRRLRRGSARRR